MTLEEYEIKKKAQKLVRIFFHKNLLSMSQTNFEYVKFPNDKQVGSCAVECAIICANQVMSELESSGITDLFWRKVKQELEKMK